MAGARKEKRGCICNLRKQLLSPLKFCCLFENSKQLSQTASSTVASKIRDAVAAEIRDGDAWEILFSHCNLFLTPLIVIYIKFLF